MSPEQIRGEHLDARTDLFSFGLVLYELVTRRAAFSGPTSGVIVDSILNRSPAPPRTLNPDLPLELDRILTKALEKDREIRYQTASDPNLISDAAAPLVSHRVEKGQLDIAYRMATSLVERHPRNGRAHWALAYVFRYAGLLDEAARECDPSCPS
jgi:serine/threonine protein kinase